MDGLVQAIAREVDAAMPKRQRARKAVDQQMFEAQVESLICEAIYRDLEGADQWTTIPRAKEKLGRKSRYRAPPVRESIRGVLDCLSSPDVGLLEQRKGEPSKYERGQQTTFRASEKLLDQVSHLGIGWDDFDRREGEEVIILKSARVDHWSGPEWLEYEDTDETAKYRTQIQVINEWLRCADIRLDCSSPLDDDLSNRQLKRYFNCGRFDRGGRLFGGFWQAMSKTIRKDLLIDGERAVELDFSQVGPRILYGMAGMKLDHDAYAVPGFEGSRDGIKKLFAAMTNTGAPLQRFPEQTGALFPKGTKAVEACGAILKHHSAIEDRFHRQEGLAIMFHESQIMVSSLLRMKAAGIVALPVHDAAIVAAGAVETAKAIMLEEFHRHTGVEGAVSIA
ncbi:hypothetical protein WT15_20560 [Burkholderia stagnalis]|nr:hypothetical protein WT74_02540 [Burkholderia stagnalis]KVN75938.1 hypothetical protein WT15_20560 [Burkholderia stagnalis]KWO31867.1 hypothetical protein WT96_23070 [Burkholderia stagnalis]KWO40565.1 hypothetical protein WT95_00310 [Burkholderia stagnalis]